MTTLGELTVLDVLSIAAAAAVLMRVCCLAKCLHHKTWPGQVLRFLAFSLSLAGMGAAAFGVAAGLPLAGAALLIAVAGVILFDRRQIGVRKTGKS